MLLGVFDFKPRNILARNILARNILARNILVVFVLEPKEILVKAFIFKPRNILARNILVVFVLEKKQTIQNIRFKKLLVFF